MSRGADLAARIEKAFNEESVDAFAECFTEDAVQYHSFFPEPLSGREAIRQAEGAMFAAFGEIRFEVSRVIEQGDDICLEARVTARNTKPLAMPDGERPATDRVVDLTMAALFRVDDDGQITESRRYQDNLTFLRQLGLA